MYPIYLDFNRTTPLAPSVLEAMQSYWSQHFMLPGQEHPQARAIAEALEAARENVASMVGCEAFEIVFTGGGTEANNLAILGMVNREPSGHIIVSALEHDSVLQPVMRLAKTGWQVDVIPVDADGTVDPARFEHAIRPNTRLVCLQAVNPVLGTFQPVRQVADICHSRGIAVHCDGTQMFGKTPVSITQLRADTLSISGHKLYGPKGSGALFIRGGYHLEPVVYGELREMGLRAGADNVPGWIGLGAAASLASRCCDEAEKTLQANRNYLSMRLRKLIDPAPMVICESSRRLANTLTIELPGEARVIQKAARELVFSTSRSASPPDEMMRGLSAIGRTEFQIGRTISLSLGWTTSRDQIDRAAELLAEAIEAAAI